MATVTPRTLSGFMELLPAQQQQLERMMDILRTTYSRYGFTPLDTPVIEASEVLLAKGGGETEKQIYRFQKGDADLALRFDLTVPLAKYVALHGNDLAFPFRRYQIGKVYRGERAQRGRFREFYQADIDIIGDGKLDITNEAEIPSIIYQTFTALGLTRFQIRVNNRKILNGFYAMLGLTEKSGDIMRTVDKLDKIGADGVEKELSEAFGADGAKKLVELTESLGDENEKAALEKACSICPEAGENLVNIFGTVRACGFEKIRFDASLVRGMNYYTGTIFEISYGDYGISVGGGGRYDELLGKLIGGKVCACGFSIGFERIFNILKDKGMTVDDGQGKVVFLTEKNASPAVLSSALSAAAQKRTEGNVCLVLKKIKNFGFQLSSLKQAGYTEFFVCSEQGIKKLD